MWTKRLVQALFAVTPLALTPLAVLGLAEYGGSEKDIQWALPWALGSLVYAGSSLILIKRGWRWAALIRRSVAVAVAFLVLAALVLAMAGQLGIAGRF